jgi:hypothetical protein
MFSCEVERRVARPQGGVDLNCGVADNVSSAVDEAEEEKKRRERTGQEDKRKDEMKPLLS